MQVPTTIDQWNLEAIRDLVTRAVFEGSTFDFKEQLPHKKDASVCDRLSTACAAFANTAGGFLIFGVKDSRDSPPDDRVIGVPIDQDFMQEFTKFAAACSPPLIETPHRAVPLSSSRQIVVVEIPLSRRRPHALGGPGKGWRIPIRTDQGGTHWLEYHEVREAFLSNVARRSLTEQLRAELRSVGDALRGVDFVHVPQGLNSATSAYSLKLPIEVSLEAVERLVVAGAVIGADERCFQDLSKLRRRVPEVNSFVRELRTRLEKLGDLQPAPPLGAKMSARQLWTEARDDWQSAREEIVRTFTEQVRSAANDAGSAAFGAEASLRALD